jgi:hypothetical protein
MCSCALELTVHTFWQQDDETATVADSVEFETNPDTMCSFDKEAPENDKEAPATDKEATAMEQSAPLSDQDACNDPLVVMDKEAPAVEQQAPGDAVMPDAADESQIEEISTGGNFALFMAQV